MLKRITGRENHKYDSIKTDKSMRCDKKSEIPKEEYNHTISEIT